jgi:hypothetical protein
MGKRSKAQEPSPHSPKKSKQGGEKRERREEVAN